MRLSPLQKGQKQPACEVELHKALKKILEELEPLETKINQSVRRMRKRLCQEWLNYIERCVLVWIRGVH